MQPRLINEQANVVTLTDFFSKYQDTKQSFNRNQNYLQNQELFEHDSLFIPTVKIGHT